MFKGIESKNCCPHCGSKDVGIEVMVPVMCHIEDGNIVLDDCYYDREAEELSDTVACAGCKQFTGICHSCGRKFDVALIDAEGVYFKS